jgi:hypothetical protein
LSSKLFHSFAAKRCRQQIDGLGIAILIFVLLSCPKATDKEQIDPINAAHVNFHRAKCIESFIWRPSTFFTLFRAELPRESHRMHSESMR